MVAKALSALRDRYPDLHLCVASSRLDEHEWRTLAQLGITSRIVQVANPDDALLRSLYTGAMVFLYPSLYEGFGLPPLEAMQCGTQVIASDASSIPEVVGDAALLVDPRNLDQVVDSITALLDSPALRSDYVSCGFQRAPLFQWNATAQQTYRSYQMLL